LNGVNDTACKSFIDTIKFGSNGIHSSGLGPAHLQAQCAKEKLMGPYLPINKIVGSEIEHHIGFCAKDIADRILSPQYENASIYAPLSIVAASD
jgi:hypothetical protein